MADEATPKPDEFGLHHCPHCTDAIVDLEEHWKTCREYEPDSLAEARRLIADHEKQRMQACHDEIAAVLDKYGMSLVIEPGRATLTAKKE
jgi:hypothetical protein